MVNMRILALAGADLSGGGRRHSQNKDANITELVRRGVANGIPEKRVRSCRLRPDFPSLARE